MVDERGTYRTDKHFPNAIFLATVLRWNITSSYVSGVGPGLINPPDNTAFRVRLDDEGGSEVNQVNPATIRADNTRTVVSAAMLLADLIESHEVAVFGAFTKLAIGKEESSRLVHRLRHSDEEAFWDWLDRDGCAYYIKGHELYQALRSRTLAATEGNRCPTDGIRTEIHPTIGHPLSAKAAEKLALVCEAEVRRQVRTENAARA